MIWILTALVLALAAFGYLVYRNGWTGAVAVVAAFGAAMWAAGADVLEAFKAMLAAFGV